jgi:RecB family endonuclease NucS
MNWSKVSERQLREKIEATDLLTRDPEIGLKGYFAREVKIGSFTLDLLGKRERGDLVIVEFKANAHKNTLGQLLLYPRALRSALGRKAPRIRTVLVSPFIDRGVVDLARKLRSVEKIVLRLAVSVRGRVELIDPAKVDATSGQCWEQSDPSPKKHQVTWRDGAVTVNNRVLGQAPD